MSYLPTGAMGRLARISGRAGAVLLATMGLIVSGGVAANADDAGPEASQASQEAPPSAASQASPDQTEPVELEPSATAEPAASEGEQVEPGVAVNEPSDVGADAVAPASAPMEPAPNAPVASVSAVASVRSVPSAKAVAPPSSTKEAEPAIPAVTAPDPTESGPTAPDSSESVDLAVSDATVAQPPQPLAATAGSIRPAKSEPKPEGGPARQSARTSGPKSKGKSARNSARQSARALTPKSLPTGETVIGADGLQLTAHANLGSARTGQSLVMTFRVANASAQPMGDVALLVQGFSGVGHVNVDCSALPERLEEGASGSCTLRYVPVARDGQLGEVRAAAMAIATTGGKETTSGRAGLKVRIVEVKTAPRTHVGNALARTAATTDAVSQPVSHSSRGNEPRAARPAAIPLPELLTSTSAGAPSATDTSVPASGVVPDAGSSEVLPATGGSGVAPDSGSSEVLPATGGSGSATLAATALMLILGGAVMRIASRRAGSVARSR